MNPIAKAFVRAKHWQIFLLLIGLYAAVMVATFFRMVPGTSSGGLGGGDFLIGGLLLLWISITLGWFWSLGAFFNSLVGSDLRPKKKFFKAAVVYPGVYVLFFLPVFLGANPFWFLVILPFHLLAMFCMFYCLYFVAKNMAMAEMGRRVSFYDYAGPFFLLWFFFIGVWIIQPRANRLYTERGSFEAGQTMSVS